MAVRRYIYPSQLKVLPLCYRHSNSEWESRHSVQRPSTSTPLRFASGEPLHQSRQLTPENSCKITNLIGTTCAPLDQPTAYRPFAYSYVIRVFSSSVSCSFETAL